MFASGESALAAWDAVGSGRCLAGAVAAIANGPRDGTKSRDALPRKTVLAVGGSLPEPGRRIRICHSLVTCLTLLLREFSVSWRARRAPG